MTAKGCDLWRITFVFLFAGLLVSSTVYPWYLLWVLVFVPLYFDKAMWVFSLTVGWSYVALLSDEFALPTWLRFVEYVPVYALVGWQVWQSRQRTGTRKLGC